MAGLEDEVTFEDLSNLYDENPDSFADLFLQDVSIFNLMNSEPGIDDSFSKADAQVIKSYEHFFVGIKLKIENCTI